MSLARSIQTTCDDVALDVEPDDVGRVLARLGLVRRELDAAGLAASADLHLRLDARPGSRCGSAAATAVVDGRDRLAVRDGDVVAREQLLALIFEQVHGYTFVQGSQLGSCVGRERCRAVSR